MNAIATKNQSQALATQDALHAVREYVEASTADATHAAYAQGLAAYNEFLSAAGAQHSAESVAAYLSSLAQSGAAVATVELRLAAIRAQERIDGTSHAATEIVRKAMRGIRRTHGGPQREAAPFLVEDVRAFLSATAANTDAKTLRDRALIAVGFAMAARRSELAALCVEDLKAENGGYTATTRKSKTDQDGQGHRRAIPPLAARALDRWLAAACITSGPVFRSVTKGGKAGTAALTGRSISRIVEQAAITAGHSPADAVEYSGHSLRAGHATSAAAAGLHERDIMDTTGHRSTAMVRRYIRNANVWTNSTAAALL